MVEDLKTINCSLLYNLDQSSGSDSDEGNASVLVFRIIVDEKRGVRFHKGFGINNIRLERQIGGRVSAPRIFATKA